MKKNIIKKNCSLCSSRKIAQTKYIKKMKEEGYNIRSFLIHSSLVETVKQLMREYEVKKEKK